MSRFRKVDLRLWADENFRELSDDGKLVWLYLLTGLATTNIPGVIIVSRGQAADALGWSIERFLKGYGEPFANGMTKADWKAGLVWLPKATSYNRPENRNVVLSWKKTWDTVPECTLKREISQHLKEYLEGLGEGYPIPFPIPSPRGMPKGMPNQEQEQEQERNIHRSFLENDPSDCELVRDGFLCGLDALFRIVARWRTSRLREMQTDADVQAKVDAVWNHYLDGWQRVVGGKNPPKPNDTRRGKIKARLAEGYTVDQINAAVDAMWASGFHVEGKHYDIELVCRNSVKLDSFLARTERDARPLPTQTKAVSQQSVLDLMDKLSASTERRIV